ncbi:Trehalose transport system permease protein SugA [Paenibacillus auburnensis]|jgi:multiple sugar transport system permease protein|uniref:Trehalose transport system permease protein SugA n=1 Tax=Paenibacillus auburnensis TaxID=2905649 RepID=A0ABN8GT17_9BACL|nr:sugar ABC transporter permease [Paenibacillus auburnensis]CAH1217100.1 Trehalose transport system permease protein SugA [Paenibacillus auburnensis]
MELSQSTGGKTLTAKTKASRKKMGDRWFPYLLIAPTVLLIAGLLVFPIFRVFDLSVQSYDFTRLQEAGYIGLENFRNIFTQDEMFYSSLGITLKWVLMEVMLQLVFGLIVALLLNQAFRMRGLVRSLVLVPWAVSGVLTTMLWSLMFNQHIGIFNDILLKLGLIHEPIAWLANIHTVFGSVVVAELWRGIPFFAITLLAALQTIPHEVYESCEVDGAGSVKKLFFITLPYLKESIVFATLLRAIWEFNSIDMIFTMTNGGPMDMTTTLPIYMMKTSILEGNYGYGSALGVVTFAFLMIFVILYLRLNRSGGMQDE